MRHRAARNDNDVWKACGFSLWSFMTSLVREGSLQRRIFGLSIGPIATALEIFSVHVLHPFFGQKRHVWTRVETTPSCFNANFRTSSDGAWGASSDWRASGSLESYKVMWDDKCS